MKSTIDQSLLDQLPIGGPIMDFNFAKDWVENTAMFHASFTMEDDTKEISGYMRIQWKLFIDTLN